MKVAGKQETLRSGNIIALIVIKRGTKRRNNMGMGYFSNHATTIEPEDIRKLCSETFEAFTESIKKHEVDIGEVAQMFKFDDFEDFKKEIADNYKAFQKDFNEKTELKISIDYHACDDEGSRYDDLDGVFWRLDGVYVLSDAAKRLKDKATITDAAYVVFG
jgi:hypothetical protein